MASILILDLLLLLIARKIPKMHMEFPIRDTIKIMENFDVVRLVILIGRVLNFNAVRSGICFFR